MEKDLQLSIISAWSEQDKKEIKHSQNRKKKGLIFLQTWLDSNLEYALQTIGNKENLHQENRRLPCHIICFLPSLQTTVLHDPMQRLRHRLLRIAVYFWVALIPCCTSGYWNPQCSSPSFRPSSFRFLMKTSQIDWWSGKNVNSDRLSNLY